MWDTGVKRSGGSDMWRALGERAHVCRIHDGEESLLETLTAFVSGALWAGDGAVVIACDARLLRLDTRLRQSGLDLLYLHFRERNLPVGIDTLLPQVMVDGWPDAARFREVMSATLARVRRDGDRLRIHDGMASVLWEQGHFAAGARLESLWSELVDAQRFQLLCAYSSTCFAQAPADTAREVRAAHSAVLSG